MVTPAAWDICLQPLLQPSRLAGQVADRAGDDRHPVAALGQVAGQLVVAGAARLVEGGKSLVDEQDMHRLKIIFQLGAARQGDFRDKMDWQGANRREAHRQRRDLQAIGGRNPAPGGPDQPLPIDQLAGACIWSGVESGSSTTRLCSMCRRTFPRGEEAQLLPLRWPALAALPRASRAAASAGRR